MTRVRVLAHVHRRERSRRKRTLLIETTQERTHVPCVGDALVITPTLKSTRSITLRVFDRRIEWGENGKEAFSVLVYGSYDHLIHLAIMCGWRILAGHDVLTIDQRSLITCADGTCNQTHGTTRRQS